MKLICYGCQSDIPPSALQTPVLREERMGRRSRLVDDAVVMCPQGRNATYHPPGTGWNHVSKATERGDKFERRERAHQRRLAAELLAGEAAA